MKFLVTGAIGFIGAAVVLHLLDSGQYVMGIDNHNDYYDPLLKEARLARFSSHPKYTHLRADLADYNKVSLAFSEFRPDYVINLAAQPGVRYSIENPFAYINSNIVGFANILEACRHAEVSHLIYASSSSVYGANTKAPYSVKDNVDHPISLYAATKKSNELMAHAYSHLYGMKTTGLRFFTVYGPWGRPDMALFKFTKAIINDLPIQVFNSGNHYRDFTYIDDIVEGIIRVIDEPCLSDFLLKNIGKKEIGTSESRWNIYNIGSGRPIKLLEYISSIEKVLGKKAIIEKLPHQPGDMLNTYADVSDLIETYGYQPKTPIDLGIANFVAWYKEYLKL